jgi:hypothetical protein
MTRYAKANNLSKEKTDSKSMIISVVRLPISVNSRLMASIQKCVLSHDFPSLMSTTLHLGAISED